MRSEIQKAIEVALQELGIEPVSFVVEHPADLTHGDYASNVALMAFKGRRKFEAALDGDAETVNVRYGTKITSPRYLAEQLVPILAGKLNHVAAIEVAGPGFLNFRLSRDFFSEKIALARTAGAAWGSNTTLAGQEVLVEYTSPNLFKPLHIGNLVGNIIGESLTRLFEAAGATVRRLNYPSDIGPTVAKAVWGLRQTGGDPDDINALGEAYRFGNEAFETDEEKRADITAINEALYAGTDATLNELRARGIATSKKQLLAICARLGTQFDAEIPESEAGPIGAAIVREHVGDVFCKSEGAVVYPEEKSGLHTRVFLNSKGLPTYEAKDLGNFVRKQELYPEWKRSIVVTGNEQTEYFKVVYAAIRELFPAAREKSLEHVPTGFLTLTTGKMSSRKGNVLTGESLLEDMEEAARERAADARTDSLQALTEQVAVAALKYQILKHSVGSNIVFDREKALSFEGDSGPYLQYTHARIVSVLEKAAEAGVSLDTQLPPPTPYTLEKFLYRFPEVIEAALAERAPHLLTTFLTQLAGEFNTFYAHEKIADPDDVYAPYKAAVADAVRQTLKNGLWALGSTAPRSM